MGQQEPSSAKPTWQIHVRKAGATQDPWHPEFVDARSVLQAEAILRRAGYEAALQTARVVKRPSGYILAHAELEPLKCSNCGYPLDGLMIQESYVRCPECAYLQPLMLWVVEESRDQGIKGLIGCFAMIGVASTILILLLFVLVLIW